MRKKKSIAGLPDCELVALYVEMAGKPRAVLEDCRPLVNEIVNRFCRRYGRLAMGGADDVKEASGE